MRLKNNGSALILVMIVTSVLLLAAIGATLSSVSNVGVTQDEKIKTELELACESAINRAKSKIDLSFNNSNLVALEPMISFQGSDEDETNLTPSEKAYNDETFSGGGNLDYYEYTVTGAENKNITVRYAIVEDKTWTKDITYTSYDMNIEAVAFVPGVGWYGMAENASARRSTLFMYNIFFEDELEILPGPNFHIKGLIHTNKNLYLNAENTMQINTDSMTSAGEIFRRRFNNTSSNGTVKISQKDEDGDYITMNRSPKEDSTNSDWVNIAQSNWKGTVRDKHLGATKLEAPEFGSFEPGGYYDQKAGLRIKVLAKGKITPTYEITYNNTATLSNSDIGDALDEEKFYDQREDPTKSDRVKVTELDLEKLKNSGYWPDNGLIYITRDDAVKDNDGDQYNPDPNRNVSGIRLKNGEELHDAMTLVSDLPTYIKGDFNLHTSEDPLTDKWKPAAIVADAITILSNSWNDLNSGNLKPGASNTTVNTVFVTGNVPTNPNTGQYSGGLENFPRFLESWSGDSLNINGGFIQLFRSQYATGKWSGNYYNAPVRNWFAEERFSNLNEFPPGFTDLFPSTNFGITYSNWSQISQNQSELALE